ncbi:hypothetical protein EDC04DRAFT_2597784 [Pisolithus marmoratus]|nr:hypothetical protein EDC04DRAFT_2597784 [Pisolithus marmoratus]
MTSCVFWLQVIPIHWQQFPVTVPLSPQTKVDVNVPIYSNANTNSVAEDGSVESIAALIMSSYAAIMRPNHQEHKICNLDITMGQFIMTHHLHLQQPLSCLHAMDGDLYIHHYGDKIVQIWLREGDQWVGDILDSHHHPLLQDYHLFVTDGIEPTWVTKKDEVNLQGEVSWSAEDGQLNEICMNTKSTLLWAAIMYILLCMGSNQRWSCSGTRSALSSTHNGRSQCLHDEKQ